MNYFKGEEEEEEEDEEEEEGNYIQRYIKNNKNDANIKNSSSTKQKNSSLTMNNPEEEEEKIINRDDEIIKSENNNEMNNNNFISYLDSNSSRPDTPKLNNIKTNEENNNKKNENCDKKNEINNIIFSETLKTKLKDINSNSVSILENNNEILEYDENRNSRQTFYKNENIDENQNINNKELQKEISKEVKEEKTKIKEELIDNKNKINDNISKENLILNEEKIQEEEKNIIIENNDSGSKNQIDNKYNDKIKEKLKQIENLNMINANSKENKKIIINNDKKEENLNNIPNNINYINFKDMKEIYKENYSIEEEREKESYKEIFNEKEIENKKVNNIDDLIHNINANNIDNLVIPILSNNNIVVENEINKKRNKTKKIKDIKQLNKSKSSEQFNTKFKMNKSSFKWLSTYNEKLISKIILSNSDKDKKISIFGIIKTLHSLKILHILLSKNNINLNELIKNIQNINEKETEKIKELEFVEQIWFLLNPNNEKKINSEIFECFIKLLYPYTNNLKKSAISYIEEYIKIINFMEPKDENKNIEEYYYSPLRKEYFPKNIKWSIEKIVQTFFELKRNGLAYKKNYENLNKVENKSKEKNKKQRKNFNFDKLYESFMIKKEAREKTLNIMREEQKKEKEEIISQYTYIPKIIRNKENKWKNINDNNNNKSVYDKLYEKRNDKNKKIKILKNKLDEEKKEKENFPFKPEVNKFENYKKIYEKNRIPENCKKYIKKNLELIKRKNEMKIEEEENKYNGNNYEKIKKIKFKCEGALYEPKKIHNEKIMKDIEDKDSFTFQIKLPNKKDINLIININENIEQKVEEFCKIYSLNNNIKEKIINQIESNIELYQQEYNDQIYY